MTLPALRQCREYMETARTLLRAAETITDRAVEGQLRALAKDFERRADGASRKISAAVSAARKLMVKDPDDLLAGSRISRCAPA